MRFAGHRWRAKQRLAGDLLLWSPNHGKRRVGRPAITYIDQLCRDTGCLLNDLPALLQDSDECYLYLMMKMMMMMMMMMNGGVEGGVWILLFSEGTLFAYNVSTIFSPIVV